MNDAATLHRRMSELEEGLRARRATMVAYLDLRADMSDMRGVQEAASDIREIDAQLAVLKELQVP